MRQWDIVLFPFREELPHPAVIVSNDERCENADLDVVNALICTSAQLNRPPRKDEIILDESDGLDWKTAVRCAVIYLLPKAEFTGIVDRSVWRGGLCSRERSPSVCAFQRPGSHHAFGPCARREAVRVTRDFQAVPGWITGWKARVTFNPP